MKNAMRGELNNYNQTGHDTSTYGWNSFQKTLGCCGVESYKDWNGTYFDNTTGKVHIFWEGHKILQNIHLTFDWHYIGQK